MKYFREMNELRKARKRARMFDTGKEALFHLCNQKFWNLRDAKLAMFQTIVSCATQDELEEMSNKFGQVAHEKGRNAVRRETRAIEI